MKVKDLIAGMEARAMDAQFQKDICALYETKDYGDTEPDCQTGYAKLLPLLAEDQKMSLEQMEQAYILRRNYAAQYGFKCGIFGAFRQFFGYSKASDGGFDDLVFQDLLMQPGMQRHHENYANIELCNEIDRAIMDALSEENIEGRPVWKPMHAQPVFASAKYVTADDTSVSMDLFTRGVCLPSDTKTDLADIDRICDIIKSLF